MTPQARQVIDLKNITDVPLDSLLLDDENPRFAGAPSKLSQKEIAKNLWQETHLDELILSISVNGYYRQEPLLIAQEKDKHVVIEGNRRLASILILLNPEFAKYVGAKASELPAISVSRTKELENLPVIKYKNREELWTYLSFRHINGPRSWSAISKAEFVAQLHQEMHVNFEEILKSTGDKNRTSIKLYNGLMVLRQGEEITRFSRKDFYAAKFNFSHLYTIIQFPDAKKFLGIEKHDSSKPFSKNPVPVSKKKELEELLIWIFGSKSLKIESVIKSQNPDLRMLDDIISNKEALSYLRESRNLLASHEYTQKEDRRLETFIMRAESNLRKAKSVEDYYKGDEQIVEKVKNIYEISLEMYEKMSKQLKKNK